MSVLLPPALRKRVAKEARKRSLKLSSTLRALVQERVQELDEQETLTRAEEWQRAQVWATWERFQAGDREEVPIERTLRRATDAVARLRKRRS